MYLQIVYFKEIPILFFLEMYLYYFYIVHDFFICALMLKISQHYIEG